MMPMLRPSIHSTPPPGPTCCRTPAHPVEVEAGVEVGVGMEVDTRNGGKRQKIGLLGEYVDVWQCHESNTYVR